MRNWRETDVSYRRPKGNKGREVDGCLFCEDDAGPQGKKRLINGQKLNSLLNDSLRSMGGEYLLESKKRLSF